MLDVQDFIKDRGGDPQKILESQQRRYASQEVVQEVQDLFEDSRTSIDRVSPYYHEYSNAHLLQQATQLHKRNQRSMGSRRTSRREKRYFTFC